MDEKMAEGVLRAAHALVAIDPYRKTHRGKAHVIECPNCKGRLQFVIAASNGHCTAACETPDCVAFME